jgi:hypothetical protein
VSPPRNRIDYGLPLGPRETRKPLRYGQKHATLRRRDLCLKGDSPELFVAGSLPPDTRYVGPGRGPGIYGDFVIRMRDAADSRPDIPHMRLGARGFDAPILAR